MWKRDFLTTIIILTILINQALLGLLIITSIGIINSTSKIIGSLTLK